MFDETTSYIGPERRHAERFGAGMAIGVREAGRHVLPATMVSLSRFGCGVANVTLADSGGLVWIRIPGLESLAARRCWSTFSSAGFAFARPLHPAVAEQFRGVPLESQPIAQAPAERRLEPRYPAPAAAADGFTLDGRPTGLRDISASGLRLRGERGAEIGRAVKVAFADFHAIEGMIAWTGGGATGVRLPANSLDLYEAA